MTLDNAAPTDPADDDAPEILDDMSGELDEDAADPDDTTEPGPAETDDDADDTDTIGTVRGGPYDGRTVTSRYPKGFLLADKARRLAYVYDYDGAGSFICRAAAGVPLDDDGRWRAAEGSTYDVIAYDDAPAARQVHS